MNRPSACRLLGSCLRLAPGVLLITLQIMYISRFHRGIACPFFPLRSNPSALPCSIRKGVCSEANGSPASIRFPIVRLRLCSRATLGLFPAFECGGNTSACHTGLLLFSFFNLSLLPMTDDTTLSVGIDATSNGLRCLQARSQRGFIPTVVIG